MRSSKVRRVHVSPELVTEVLTVGYCVDRVFKVTDGIPKGSLLVGVGYDPQSRTLAFDFCHDSFAAVAEGAIPGSLMVVIQKYQTLAAPASEGVV